MEYLDLCSAWLAYVDGSGAPRNWFNRDKVHANDRGMRVLGQMMTAYFKPR